MKKFIVLIVSIITISAVCVCYIYSINHQQNNSIVTLDFQKREDKTASLILYDYILKYLKMTPKQAEDFARIMPEMVTAYRVDLNDDGTDEIIGACYSTFYWGTAGFSMFILQLQNDEYVDIAGLINFETQIPVYILKTKTNNFKDIKFSGSSAFKFKSLIAKYNGEKYVSKEEEDLFLKYLKDFSDYDVSEITNEKE